MPTKLILIRHGETKWNRDKRYCGSTDIPLSNIGKLQASAVINKLKNEKIHKIYCSAKLRTIQTAKIIFKDKKILKRKKLDEISFGCFEGLTHSQIMKKFPEIYTKWLKNPHTAIIPKGESFSKFSKRIVTAFKKIISANMGKTIAIVCHGGSISSYITSLNKKNNFWENIPNSASITIVEFKNG